MTLIGSAVVLLSGNAAPVVTAAAIANTTDVFTVSRVALYHRYLSVWNIGIP